MPSPKKINNCNCGENNVVNRNIVKMKKTDDHILSSKLNTTI
jgi:hypothetical protein